MSGETRIPDFKALEALFKRFYKPLRAYAYRFVADEYQAEDIVQDVFLDIWQRHESIRFDDESIKSYLFKAVYTHAINLLNRQPQTISSLNQGQEVDMLKLYISDDELEALKGKKKRPAPAREGAPGAAAGEGGKAL